MRKNMLVISLIAVISCGILPSVGKAQTTGTIFGFATDSTGAIVPGTLITVTEQSTGFSREMLTGSEGNYIVPRLSVGTYSVTATLDGFKTFTRENVILEVDQNARVDVLLEVGGLTDIVLVLESGATVETRAATLGETVDQLRIDGLPLNGRNFLQLSVLQPGATPGLRLSSNNTAPTPGGSANSPQVNGLRGQSNNYLLDGANNNEAFLGEAGLVPPPDALKEFRILTNSYSAEYGRGGGSIMSVITQSGSNTVHGSVYEFLRREALDARNFFAMEKSPLKRNQFGFSLGGPLSRDNTFLFGSFEGFRESRTVALSAIVPTALENAGDFSKSANKPKDPNTGQRFPGDIVPRSAIGKNIMSHYPYPNDPSGLPIHRFQGQRPTDRDNLLFRFDHRISEKQEFTARYGFMDGVGQTPRVSANFGGIISLPDFRALDTYRVQNVTLQDNYVATPNLVNTLRLSFYRYGGKAFFGAPPAVTTKDVGFTFPVGVKDELALPQIVVPGLTAFGYSTSGPTDRAENSFQLEDTIAYVRGDHSLKFGVQLQRIRHTYVSPQAFGGTLAYFGGASGNATADLLLDKPTLILQGAGSADRDWRSFWAQLYFQDDIHVTSRFTLNFGFRYEAKTPYKELRDRRATFRPGVQSTVYKDAAPGQLYPGDSGVTDTTVQLRHDLAPRIGFAWDVFGDASTSLRGGYGMFYDTPSFFILHQSVVAPPFLSFYVGFGPLPNPFASNPIVNPDGKAPFAKPYQLTFMEPNWKNPYAQQWNLTFQRQLPADFLFEIAYVGTAARHLPGAKNINSPIHIPGVDPVTGEPLSTAGNAQSRRPYPDFSVLLQLSTEFNSSYNGLQMSVKKPFSYGLSLGSSYTYSKVLDTNSFPGPFRAALNQTASQLATYDDLSKQKGRALFDVRERFVLNWIWEIPAFNNQGGAAEQVLGGWSLTGIVAAQTGFPFTVFDTSNPSCPAFDYALDRTDLKGDPNTGPRTVDQWFNTSAFLRLKPCSATRGNAGRNIVDGPGFQNWDLGVRKNISIGEKANLQFRAEFFNAFNHPNFDIPDNNIASPTFGRILSTTLGNEREIQFGIRLQF